MKAKKQKMRKHTQIKAILVFCKAHCYGSFIVTD